MDSILKIDNEIFFNKNLIKVFDGIAGSAKSTSCARLLDSAGVSFLRCTSTNKLKKDAARRFGGNNTTIASGLFNTEDGAFYSSEKEIKYSTVLIDEALQADKRVLEWCSNNVGKVNIIICTDSRQMLPPDGNGILNYFEQFCSMPYVYYTQLTDTLRAIDDNTKKIYNRCYAKADEPGVFLYNHYKKTLKIVPLSEVSYNCADAYITHTNDIEDYLYTIWDMQSRYDAPLLPKGTLSSKDVINFEKYPILPQKKIKNINSYLQIENIGTVTRYQGSEIEPNRKLYYFVTKDSYIENREFYTMITRAKTIDSIKLVIVDLPKKVELTEYAGKPIIKKDWADISATFKVTEDKTIADIIKENGQISYIEKQNILNKINTNHNKYIIGFSVDGKNIKEESLRSSKITMNSLIKKEPLLRSDFMNEFYKIYDEIITKYGDKTMRGGSLWTPQNIDTAQAKSPDSYKYGVDLYSAYPHCFKYGAMPDGRIFYNKNIKDDITAKKENLIRFYVNFSMYGGKGMIFTGDLVDYIKEQGITYPDDFIYIGACHKIKTTITGDYLMEKAYKSLTTKRSLKSIHYGYMQKPYIEPAFYDDRGQIESYVINEGYTLELCMVCVQSELALQMLKLKTAIYDNLSEGSTKTDCLYFDSDEEDFFLYMTIQNAIPNYNFRIFDNTKKVHKTSEKPVLYRSYTELKERSHHKKKEG